MFTKNELNKINILVLEDINRLYKNEYLNVKDEFTKKVLINELFDIHLKISTLSNTNTKTIELMSNHIKNLVGDYID